MEPCISSIGIGIDIVNVRRIDALWQRFGDAFLRRIMAADELQALQGECPVDAARLAGRWAAKEAVSKALGSGIRGFAMKDIVIINQPSGQPCVILRGGALERARQMGYSNVLISISHEKDMAVAQAVAIGTSPAEL